MRRPATSAPPIPPPRTIERGWLEYAEVIGSAAAVAETPDAVLVLLRLAYYGGAAHALGELLASDEDDRARVVEALATEVLDDADALVSAVLLVGRTSP